VVVVVVVVVVAAAAFGDERVSSESTATADRRVVDDAHREAKRVG
jgi:hypothetical protein